MKAYRPVVLAILDGWGITGNEYGNAFLKAKTPNLDSYFVDHPNTSLLACAEVVGLPRGQMGNSEVGHLNIGAGRIVYQDLTRIARAIVTGDFFKNPALLKAYAPCVGKGGASLHLMGLVSDGGVHSHLTHIYALVAMAKKMGVSKVYLHCFLDGRDVPPKSALKYLDQLQKRLNRIGVGEIATVAGRYYAMDRDNRWERVERAYNAIVLGDGREFASAEQAVEAAYAAGLTDEFVLPSVIIKGGQPLGRVNDGDSVVFFNFRADRARQLTRAFVDKDFCDFSQTCRLIRINYLCLTEYDATIDAAVAFPPEKLKNTLGEVLAAHGLRQLRIAETEKYAHVTFFFNGGVEKKNPGEDRVLIPSPKVATYDLQPEMSAYLVAETVVERINKEQYDVIILNLANLDMVGHTGVFDAAVRASEVIDECIGRVVDAVCAKKGAIIITADHGNVEAMLDCNGMPQTAHTTNPVPFILIGVQEDVQLFYRGSLRDIAPTILELLGIAKPKEMTGESLILMDTAEN